jgi:hypothetical protein
VVVTSNRGPGAPDNVIQAIRFEAAPNANALIDIAGQSGRSGAFTVGFPSFPSSVEFFIRHAGPGATTVPFIVVDDCGDWRSLAGGGPNAF